MNDPKVISALSNLGLTEYEARIYRTLVNEGVSTAKDISNICGIPYGKIYEIINSLSNKGFILTLPTKPMRYRVVSPKDLIKSVQKNYDDKVRIAGKVIVAELNGAFQANKKFVENKGGFFWIINGRSAINKKMESLFEKAEDHIYMILSSKGISRMGYYREVLKRLHKRGIKINISTFIDKDNIENVNELKFCHINHTDQTFTNQLISIDGKEAVLYEPIPDDESITYGRDLGIWISNSSFAKFIENFFELGNLKFKNYKQRLASISENR